MKREIDKLQEGDDVQKHAIAAAFQDAAVSQLEEKIILAMKKLDPSQLSSLVVSGGVASNLFLRER